MSEREKLKKRLENIEKLRTQRNERPKEWTRTLDDTLHAMTMFASSEVAALLSELEQAETRHCKFMVEGGPVVMATEYDEVKAKLLASEAALRTLRQASAKSGIYIASKTHHAQKWKALRSQGVPIISTWIDEAGIGETKSFPDLWRRCISEASSAELLIVYAEEGEQLKGALIEVGAALAGGVPVVMVGQIEPMKTAVNHSLVSKAESLEHALAAALAAEGGK